MHQPNEVFMKRCLELALQGAGNVAPNPMVGCVVVHEGKIIGEGFHKKYGEAHAEVNAINSVTNQNLLVQSTLFVNLEPCSHFGKTPPCADLIIEKKIPEVVIGCVDSNPLVSGNGIGKLRAAGIKVSTGILEKESQNLNRRFLTFHKMKRPYIILKWAQTQDGFTAPVNYERINISNENSRKLVHRWRSEESAVLVGKNTALYDNPRLDVRNWSGNNPLRIVIDNKLELPSSLNLFNHSIPTIVFSELQKKSEKNLEFIQLSYDDLQLENILNILWERKILSMMIEGGSALLHSFINKNLWDEARIFISPKLFSKGIVAPKISGRKIFEENILGDQLTILENRL